MNGNAIGEYMIYKYLLILLFLYHSQGMTGALLIESLPMAADPVPFPGMSSAQ